MVISAMKMETLVSAAVAGKVDELTVDVGDTVSQGDLLLRVVPESAPVE